MWSQVYDPFGSMVLSAAVATVPVFVLLSAIGIFEVRAHVAAILGLLAALAVAVLAYGMPPQMAGMAAAYGAAFGLLPIGWIILNVIFLYRLTSEKGEFEVLQRSISAISDDRRLQLLFIAFSLGAFFEGAAGFGTPVAVTAAMLIGLGFSALHASGLSLIANTAPVAFGALGTPVIALAAVTGLDLHELSAMIGRQLPFFAVLVPFWLIWAFTGFRKMIEVWPPILVAGVSFAIPQYLVSNFHGPWLADIVAAVISMASLALFLKRWRPAVPMTGVPPEIQRQLLVRSCATCHPRYIECGTPRLDAVARAQRLRVPVGRTASACLLGRNLDRDVSGRRLERARSEGSTRRRRAPCRERRLQFQHIVGDRHRHPDRGPHQRQLQDAKEQANRAAADAYHKAMMEGIRTPPNLSSSERRLTYDNRTSQKARVDSVPEA